MDSLRVLIAEDNESDRFLLSKILRKLGHQVIEVDNGQKAIEQFGIALPDIVLLDVQMPVMDGKKAAVAMRKIEMDKFVPILFLTSIQDVDGLTECLGVGGDDFLLKPYNPVVIKAKIEAFYRIRKMHEKLEMQRDIIAENHQHLVQEQIAAKAVFDNVAHSGNLNSDNIRYSLSPLAVFNGDVLLAAQKPSGGIHVLLGDFTGHGLPAAIGAMPLAEIFYGMTAKGFSQRDILREINVKLKNILPVGFFCCSCFVDICYQSQSMKYWMGGLPDCYLYREDGSFEVMQSSNLPMGVQDNSHFNDVFSEFQISAGDRVLMWSDGIVEARNSQGQMFGAERVHQVFEQADGQTDVYQQLQKSVNDFVGDSAVDDDMTLIEVTMLDIDSRIETEDVTTQHGQTGGPRDWHLELFFGPDSLKNYNPLPLLLHIMMEVPGLRNMGGQLYTLLAELYANALDHGILKLDSALKKSPDGFAEYYQLKDQRTQDIKDDNIVIRMRHTPEKIGGVFELEIEDSGLGFDFTDIMAKLNEKNNSASGRGILLIKELCDEIEFLGSGNIIRAKICWPKAR